MTSKPSKRVLARRAPKTPSNVKAALLKVLRDAAGELVSSRELKEKLGPAWKEALAALRAEGYAIDETLGASNNRSFRLNQDQPASPKYLTEPAPVVFVAREANVAPVSVPAWVVRSVLALPTLPNEVRDALAESLARSL